MAHGSRAFLAVVATLLTSTAIAALSPEAFTREFMTQMRAAIPGGKVELVGPMQVHIEDGKGHEQTVYLDNAYGIVQSDPDSRQAIIERFVASTVQTLADVQPADPKNIVAVVKDRGWIRDAAASLAARGAKAPPEQWSEPLNDELIVLYAEDTPNNIRYLSRADLEKAGVKVGEARALAVKNLHRMLPDIQQRAGDLIGMITADGNYEASLLLFDEIWSGGQIKVDGEIVVAVPSRDVVMFTGSRNAAGLAKLRELADQITAEGNYTLTNALFVYRKGKFETFRP